TSPARRNARRSSRCGPASARLARRSARPTPSCGSSMGRPVTERGDPRAPAPERRASGRSLLISAPVMGLRRGLIRALTATLRLREYRARGLEACWRAKQPVIYTIWHGQILLMPYLYGRRLRIHALMSRSRDGEILARFAQGFGFTVVRGSSSRGGVRALL